MSSKESNKRQKFRTPFKRKQNEENSCETPQVKRGKHQIKSSQNNEDIDEEKPSMDNKCEHLKPVDFTEDSLSVSDKHRDSVLVDNFVFVSAKGEQKVVPKQLILQMSVKFDALVEEQNTDVGDNTQIVPEVDVSDDSSCHQLLIGLFGRRNRVTKWPTMSSKWMSLPPSGSTTSNRLNTLVIISDNIWTLI